MRELELVRRMWPFLRPDAWAFAVALALTPAVAGLSLAQPYLLKRAIDDHIVPGVGQGLAGVASLFLITVVGGYVLEAGYVLSLAWGGQRTAHNADDAGRRAQSAPPRDDGGPACAFGKHAKARIRAPARPPMAAVGHGHGQSGAARPAGRRDLRLGSPRPARAFLGRPRVSSTSVPLRSSVPWLSWA